MMGVRLAAALLCALAVMPLTLESATTTTSGMAPMETDATTVGNKHKDGKEWPIHLPRCLRGEKTSESEMDKDKEFEHKILKSPSKSSSSVGSGTSKQGDAAVAWNPPDRMGSFSDSVRIKAESEFWAIPQDEIKVGQPLGEGSVGTVYEGDWRGIRVAVKSLMKSFDEESVQYRDFIREINLISGLRHPNLVTFLGVEVDAEPPCIVSELMEGGSIEDLYAQKSKEKGSPWAASRREVITWTMDVLRALRFLHEGRRCVIHRDLKPANIMLRADLQKAKLGDFGLSKELLMESNEPCAIMSGKAGTARFMAPEVFAADKQYTHKVDIYSLAMCVYFMATGVKPFDDFNDQESLGKLVSGRRLRPNTARMQWPELEKVLQKAWAADPNERPTAAEMMKMLQAEEMVKSLDVVPPAKKHNPFSRGIGSR